MGFESELNKLYHNIAQQVSDMIPIDWDEFYFNGEVKNQEGGVFFFFKPKGQEQHIYSHYIPRLYNIDKRTYNKELHKLFELSVELQKVFIANDQEPWFSVTFLVNSSGKLYVYFDYTDWHDSEFGPSARIKYFEYKYLNKNKEEIDMQLIEKMEKYQST